MVKSLVTYHRCGHSGQEVRVGNYTIWAGGRMYLQSEDLADRVLVPLTDDKLPFAFGERYSVIAAPLDDFGGVPTSWRQFLEEIILPELRSEERLFAFCEGGHGRTGTFLASLIALLENETSDPIAAVRERYCKEAVETVAQGEAVFALKGEELPGQYRDTLLPSSDPPQRFRR